MAGAVYIGTSGWHYKHWRGRFYPENLPASRMLEYYQRHFDTVELNNSFYRLPPEHALAEWRDSTPDNFCFAMKGSRFLTHMKKLKNPEQGIGRFMERAGILGPKLGPIVFQLPPWWKVNSERLEGFLDALPHGRRYSFELRNPTWHNPHIYTILEKHNAAFCIFEISGFRSGAELTADFTYVRLHGPEGAYQGSYDRAALSDWVKRIQRWRKNLRAIYVYFDNDQEAYAARNALELKSML